MALALALGGCGSPRTTDPSGYAIFFRRAGVTLSSIVLPGASVCARSFDAATGTVVATIGSPAGQDPPFIELVRGTCGAPGEVVVASPTGALAHEVGAGTYFMRITNTSEETVTFILEVEYTLPPNAPAP